MAYSTNIWGSSQLANPFNQIINLMSMDMQMKMQAEAKVRQILKEADPAKFVKPLAQEEQIRRLDVIQQEVTDLAKKRNGRFTTDDMMDINFMVDEFESWQSGQLAYQEAFLSEYKMLMQNPDKYDMEKGMAGVQAFMQAPLDQTQWSAGHMLSPRPYNPMEYYSKLKLRTEPIHSTPPDIQLIDGVYYEVQEHTYATPEEKEARVFSDYMTNQNLKAGMHKLWDEGVGGNEQLLWKDKMDESNEDPHTETKIDNPTLFQSMKTYGTQIQPNTKSYRRVPMSYFKSDDKKPKKGAELDLTNKGEPTQVVGQVGIEKGGTHKALGVDYGRYIEHPLTNIPKDTKMPLDQHTFINAISERFGISALGKPASEAKLEEDGVEKQSIAGQSYKVNNAWVYEEFPVYVGDRKRTFKVGYGKRWPGIIAKEKKGGFTLYPNQPVPDDLYKQIEDQEDDSGRKLKDEEIVPMPVAKTNLETGVRESIEVLRIFDQKLSDLFKTVNPEFELGTTLIKEPKPGRESFDMPSGKEHVYVDALGNEFTQEEEGLTDEQIQEALRLNKITRK
jgi:hypothetical protein